jgi:uncharacterized protein YbjT (DUF2867 family)
VNIILFGATGMIGQGVLRLCLLREDVTSVVSVVRKASTQKHPKLREVVLQNIGDIVSVKDELGVPDACFYALGISAAGLSEAEYAKITYDYALAVAAVLVQVNPHMTMCYVSGAGTDSTEKTGAMWAQVKGKTENALLKTGFKQAFMFRPAYIQPLHGEVSKTKSYRIMYTVMGPLYPLWKTLFPKMVTNTETVAKAMLHVAQRGHAKAIIENHEINQLVRM